MHLPQFVGSLLRLRGVEWSNDSSIRKRKESGKKQSNANRGNVPITRAGTEESHKALSRQPVRWLRSQQKLKSLSGSAHWSSTSEAKLLQYTQTYSYAVITCSRCGIHRCREKKWVTRTNYIHLFQNPRKPTQRDQKRSFHGFHLS